MSRTSRRRVRDDNGHLSRIDVHPDTDGTLILTTDTGEQRRIHSQQLGAALAAHCEEIGGPVTVALHDVDGGVHVDTLTPRTSPVDQTDPPHDRPVGVFQPGEPLHVAVGVHTTTADADGHPTAAHDLTHPHPAVGRTVLIGEASHAIVWHPQP
ncbi:hypothetical protein [Euzebya sp.]|uniref:hypothetical protein n=1 Tax=Euzebya sp. TaxID=1971409 RepID=UPI0035126D89